AGYFLFEQLAVADVAFHLLEVRVFCDRREHVAVQVQVQHLDLVSALEQSGHEHGADITGAAGDKHFLERVHVGFLFDNRRESTAICTSTSAPKNTKYRRLL